MPPVQRKVFRIEEHMRPRLRGFASVERALPQTGEFATIPAKPDVAERPPGPRVRADVADAQAYKAELVAIHDAIGRTAADMAALMAGAEDGGQASRVSRELAAIVTGTERATQAILQAAEEIDQSAHALAGALKAGHQQGLAHDIQERVVRIFEVCNFQDLTGQRVSNVVTTLKSVEERIARLFEIWQRIEHFKPAAAVCDDKDDSRFLNGPKLAGEGGHVTQSEIDEIFFGIGDTLI
ncbi:protein phosphatase CheZ [Rhodoplanes sp. Z2-YC6860]|uniref:protein phosphatase CheZ n=1 Tax=Rhodoplanes sp. Z2-YC6860 TaxID=674703 RepID=UPI00078DB87B|nr:protein phosphatase CheZ [Rhodoplanes sp. Z2-YC6860]AMN40033.1 methyl-accepting chemotaxis protein [Rhodoplanes sp. Z2-YC6860]